MDRREFIGASMVAVAGASLAGEIASAGQPPVASAVSRGRLKPSVCRWCYGSIALEDLCTKVKTMGVQSVELLSEKDWPVAAGHGLACAVANGPVSIGKGINRPDSHDAFVKESERLLPLVKAAGIPNMIIFSGNRAGQSDAEGIKQCAAAIKRITPLAQSLGVTVIMELLNSKVDHRDYQCDRTKWGVDLVHEVASDRFRLLYDIYHMQIMEGDVIRTVTDNFKWIAHYHTGGVPGRAEIDNTQELNYTAICKAIADKGYTGYLGQEFIPRHDPMASLQQALEVCTV